MTDSTREEGGDLDGLAPDEAFSVLANKTRLDVLYALWNAHDPPGTTAVPFSDLYERVDIDDTGNFSYHLNQLVGHFVRCTDSGYELRNSGRKIITTVLAGTADDNPTPELEPVDRHCICCGSRAAGYYEDERLLLRCPECDGLGIPGTPPGSLVAFKFPPAGLRDRTMTESFRACEIMSGHYAWTMKEGVCPECTSTVDLSVELCDDHHPGERDPCPTCRNYALGRAYYVCPTCKADWHAPTSIHVASHPAVIAFYYENGVESPAPLTDWETIVHRVYREYDEELLSRDPLRIRVTVPAEENELHVVLDDEMNVVSVDER
jgi:hypothetical protein